MPSSSSADTIGLMGIDADRPLTRPGTDVTYVVRRILIVLSPALAAILFGGLLPSIDLGSSFADAMVRVSDTASWTQLPFLALVVVLAAVTRPGLSTSRRSIEAGITIVVMLVVLAGNGLLNEHVVKPAIGVPRPNIVTLAEDGTLGPEISTGDDFYATGSKSERRGLLHERLTPARTPDLSPTVRSHWIHEAGYATPSGHATTAVTFATLGVGLGLLWLDGWRRRVLLIALPAWAVAVATSRLLIGVHTATDVIVGALIGVGWGPVSYTHLRAHET